MGSEKGKSSSKDRSIGKARTIAGKTFRIERLASGLVRIVKANSSSNNTRFALCIDNEGYPASLETLKVYEVVLDKFADAHGLIRVVDESGEDYLYPAESSIA